MDTVDSSGHAGGCINTRDKVREESGDSFHHSAEVDLHIVEQEITNFNFYLF
jgi:hypothetical protein